MKTIKPELRKYVNMTLADIAEAENKHVVDAMLDIAVADDLKAMFYAQSAANDLGILSEIIQDPYTIPGVSDGGAHTKYFTAGRYRTSRSISMMRRL